MAVTYWQNCKCWYGGFNISADLNKVSAKFSADALDSTVFGASAKTRAPGLLDASVDIAGLWQAGDTPDLIDHSLWDKFALSNDVMTVAPTTGAAGEVAYSFVVSQGDVTHGGAIGTLNAFQATASGAGSAFRGTLVEVGSKSTTGNGSAQNLGLLPAGKKLYAAVHVLTVSGTGGPTITFAVESDDAAGMATAVERITFPAITAPGAYLLSAADVGTDTHYRFKWTVSGTTPSFSVVTNLGFGI